MKGRPTLPMSAEAFRSSMWRRQKWWGGTIRRVGDKPAILAFSLDGSRTFVTLRGKAATGDPKLLSGSEPGLSVIDVPTGKVIAKVKLGGDPHGVAVRP